MRLSDAIATGRMLVRSLPGVILTDGDRGCAIGMAIVAAGKVEFTSSDNCLGGIWPWTNVCPPDDLYPCGCGSVSVGFPVEAEWNFAGSVIAHLFDFHVEWDKQPRWTLDQLIDWVRSVEPSEPELQQEAVPEVAAVAQPR